MYTNIVPTVFQKEVTEARQYKRWQEITAKGTSIVRHIGYVLPTVLAVLCVCARARVCAVVTAHGCMSWCCHSMMHACICLSAYVCVVTGVCVCCWVPVFSGFQRAKSTGAAVSYRRPRNYH